MKVVITSESTHTSLERETKILDSYLPRVASKTWLGKISYEGLIDLKEKLKRKATRNTAICCHILQNKIHNNVGFVIGKNTFGYNGQIAIGERKKEITMDKEMIKENKILKNIVEFAALFHDIGKQSFIFQYKLLKNVTGLSKIKINNNDLCKIIDDKKNNIRHEYISYVYFKALKNISNAKNDSDFFNHMSEYVKYNDEEHKKIWNEAIDLILCEWKNGNIFSEIIDEKWKIKEEEIKNFPVYYSILMIIATHHNLIVCKPDGLNYTNNVLMEDIGNHSNNVQKKINDANFLKNEFKNIISDKNKKNIKKASSLCCKELLWNDKNWKIFLETTTTEIVSILKNENYDQNLLYFAGFYGLKIFKLADIHASKRKKEQNNDVLSKVKKEFKDGNILSFVNKEENNNFVQKPFANTEKGINGSVYLMDDLSTHVKKVYEETQHFFRIAFQKYDFLSSKDLMDIHNRMYEGIIPKKYKWQKICFDLSNTDDFKKEKDIPKIIFLVAGTGTGKTRGAFSILSSLRDELRVTTLLSLRTLTLQTGDAYRKEIWGSESNDSNKCLTMIGGINLNADNIIENENDEILDNEIEMNFGDKTAAVLDEILKERFSPKNIDYMNFPVVVSTIDMIVSAFDYNTSNLSTAIRVVNSDFIIDELDSYSNEDLIVISRLIFMLGVYGRNVVLASATLPVHIVKAMTDVFSEGVKIYSLVNNKKNEFGAMFVSETISEQDTVYGRFENSNDCLEQYSSFVDNHSKKLYEMPVKRKLGILEIPENLISENIETKRIENINSAFYTIYKKTISNGCVFNSKLNGKKVSVGIVRFNIVENCREYMKYVAQKKDDNLYICYHSRFIEIIKNNIEQKLNVLCYRKGTTNNADVIFENEDVKRHLEKRNEINIVIVTTPIVETGRDFDVDWAITEPCTNHSLVQLAGRVRRHRNEIADFDKSCYPNIFMLSYPLKLVKNSIWNDEKEFVTPLSYPGIHTPFYDGVTAENIDVWKISDQNSKLIKDDKFMTVNDYIEENYYDNINSVYALNPDKSKSQFLQITKNVTDHILNKKIDTENSSLLNFTAKEVASHPLAFFDCFSSLFLNFRRQSEKGFDLNYFYSDSGWKITNEKYQNHIVNLLEENVSFADKMFFEEDVYKIVESLQKISNKLDDEALKILSSVKITNYPTKDKKLENKIRYSDFIGGNYTKKQ